MGVQSEKVIGVKVVPEVDPKNLKVFEKAGESFSEAVGKSFKAITAIGKETEQWGESGKALVGYLAAAGKAAGKTTEEISSVIQELNNGLGNGKNKYFATQTKTIDQMVKSYERLQKAMAKGDAEATKREAGNLTRWTNAYKGTQGGKIATTNGALVEAFGSKDAVREMAKIVKEVNGGKSDKYGSIDTKKYSVKAFQDMTKVLRKAEESFRMNMKHLVGDDYLKAVGMRKGKPSDVVAAETRAVEERKGYVIDLNKSPKRANKAEKISTEALQHRADEIEAHLDKVMDEYLNGKAKSMDEAIDRVFGEGKRQTAMSEHEEYRRITGNKKRYSSDDGYEYFKDVTPNKGGKTLQQLRRHWSDSVYSDKYIEKRNKAYADFLKAQGMDKIDLSMAPENGDLPQQFKKGLEEAYRLRRQTVQKALDFLVKRAQEEGKSLEDVLSEMNEVERARLDQYYGQFLGLGGNKDRYRTVGGDLPFQKHTSASNRNYWAGKGLKTPKYVSGIQEDLDKRDVQKKQARERQIKRGEHYVKQKTSKTTEKEDAEYIAGLVRSELERISKEVPKGDSGFEERKNQLQAKLTAVFQAAKKANEQGREFSVSGAYGQGKDHAIRSDYYEWLALGGDRNKVSWGGVNPFEANYFNAITKGGSTEQVKNRWRKFYQDSSPDAEQQRQVYERQLEAFYSQRLADLQEQEQVAESGKEAREEQARQAQNRKDFAKKFIAAQKRREERQASQEAQETKKETKEEPEISPREKRLKELQAQIKANIKNISKDNAEMLDKYSEFKALGGKSNAFTGEDGKDPFSVYSKSQRASSFQKWKKQIETPQYAKSIGEQVEAIQEENRELERNSQLKQENAAKTNESTASTQESIQVKKSELKTEQDLEAETAAAIERRKKQLEDSLATANFERELGLTSQGALIGQKSNDYFEFKALGGDVSALQKFGAKKNYFDMMSQDLKKRMEDKWSGIVKSDDYLSALRQQNAAIDENTSKVRQNQAAKASSAEQEQKQSKKTREERRVELKEQLSQMVEETRERASNTGNNFHSQFNDAQDESGYGSAIENEISQLEHLQDEFDQATEKWNEFRALGGTAQELLGSDASQRDIDSLMGLDDSSMIDKYKEQHGLIQEAIEDKKKLAETSKEAAAVQDESTADTAGIQAKAQAEKEEAEALREKAEAKKQAEEAEVQADTTTAHSARDAQRQAESAERMAKAQQEAVEAKKQAQSAKVEQTGMESSVESEKTAMQGLANTISGEVAQAIKTKTDLFTEEQAIVTGVVQAEKAELLGLTEVIQGAIPNAIEIKNASFMAEQDVVAGAVASEKAQIDSLAQDIQGKIPAAVQEIGKSMVNQEATFSSSVTNIKTIVTQLCDTLREIAAAANEISGANFDKLGEIVNPLKAYKVGQKASSNLQSFGDQVKKSTSDLSAYSKKNQDIDASAISTLGSAIKPFKINKGAAEQLKNFIAQIKEVKKTIRGIGSWNDDSVTKIGNVADSFSKFKVGKSISTNLQMLIQPLEDLQGALTALSSADIDASLIRNIFESLSNIKVNKNAGEKIKTLSDALIPLKDALMQFKGFDMSEMERLTAFLAQASNLKDVASVLRASASNVKAAKEKVDTASGVTPTQDTSQKDDANEMKNASLKKGDAIKQYSNAIKELLLLQQRMKSMEQAGLKVPEHYKQRQEELKKLIDATKTYIDTGNQEVKQDQIKTNNEQIMANQLKQQVQNTKANAQKIKEVYADINDPGTQIGGFWQRFTSIESSDIEGIETKIDGLRQKILALFEAMKMNPGEASSYANMIEKLIQSYQKASAVLTGLSKPDIQARMRQNLIAAASQKGATAQEGDIRFSGTKNMKASLRITNKKGQVEILTQEYDAQTEALSRMSSMYTTTQSSTDKFFESLKSRGRSLVTYLATFVSFYRVVDVFKKVTAQITEFDSALTQMRKVSDESIDRLKNFQKESFNMAEQIGTTAVQIQKSTADFLRLGQDFQTAKESAMNANILFNVSEFDSIDDATTSLIAMTQAYKDVEQTHIIDSINKVGNDFSISTSGLSEALQRSASALTTSGNSLEESIGMITAANQVVQDPQSVGAAMKIISLRLAGQKQQIEDMGEDTEGMVTTVSKLRAGIMNATKVASNGMKGVDIEDANGNLKNTYTILQDISDIWEQIGDQDKLNGTNQQNYLLETMAGKNRSNVLASLLQSPDVLRSAYQEALDSEGSALVENQKQLESIEGHMNRIKNEASEFATNFMSSDGLKGVIDLGTEFLKLINDISGAIGSLSTLGFLGSGIMGVKGLFGAFKDAKGIAAVDQQVNALKGAVAQGGTVDEIYALISGNKQYPNFTAKQLTSILNAGNFGEGAREALELKLHVQQLGMAAEQSSGQFSGFGSVMKAAFSGANLIPTIATITTLVISLGTAFYNAHQKAKQAAKQNASELAGQFKDTSKNIDSQIENYTKLAESLGKTNISEQESARIKSQLLDIQNQLSESYGKQAQGVDLLNGSLDDQIEKLQQIKKQKAKDALLQAGAAGQNRGDFKYAYDEMTREYTFHPGNQNYVDEPNVSGIFKTTFGRGSSLQKILEWAKKFEDQGLVVDSFGMFDDAKMTATGTAQQILDLLKQMGGDLQNIPDYDDIKDTGNFETLNDWITDATQHYQKLIDEYSDDFMQYLNMKLLADERHGIDYSFGGKEYQNKDLGGFYYRFQSAADEYAKALEGSDDEAIEEAKSSFESMRDAWSKKISEMHEAGDDALDDYQLLMDGVIDSVSTNAINAYNLSKEYKSQGTTPLKHWAKHISDHGISSQDFESAAKTQGIQQGEYYVNRVLQEALNAGYITDIKDEGQIVWLIEQMKNLGIFADSAANSGKKAEGTYASFLETVSGKDGKTFSELIDDVQSKSSSLTDWLEKLKKGEVDQAGLTDLFNEFPDLASNMQFVQSVTDNMNAEGFVEYTEDMKSAIADVNFKTIINNIREMNQELADEDSYTEFQRNRIRAQRDLLIDQLDLSGISVQQMLGQIYKAEYKEGETGQVRNFLTDVLSQQNGTQIVARLLLDDKSATWDYQEWKAQVEAQAVEIELRADVKDFKKSIESVQQMTEKNAKITSFEESLDSGKAKAEDLLSLISSYPTEFEAISSTVSDVLSKENIDGTIDGAQELSDVLSHLKVTNLEDSLLNAKTGIEKIIAYSQADLSGISSEDAVELMESDKRGYGVGGQTKKDLLEIAKTGSQIERQAAVVAFGMQISFSDALEYVQNQLEKTAVSAIKEFDSMSDAVTSFKEKAASESVTSDDVLGLVETFPEIIQETDVLGAAFSDLTLNGVLSDATELERILTEIEAKKLADALDLAGVKDQDVIQGLANQIDFSSISEEQAQSYATHIKDQLGLDLSEYVSTKEGRGIIGNINFVIDNAKVTDLGKVVSNAVSQSASDGLKKAMSDTKALDSAFSTLESYSEKALSGQLTASDLDSIYETFGDLITDGDQLNALYGSINMDNLVTDAQTAFDLLNNIKKAKIEKYFEEQEESGALSKEAQRAIVNQTRFTGVTEDQAREAMKSMQGKPYVAYDKLSELMAAGQYSAVVRMSLYPDVQNREEFQANLQAAIEGYAKDVEQSLKVGIEIVANINSTNSSISDFADKLESGEATYEDLFSMIKDAPKLADEAAKSLSSMFDDTRLDGTLKDMHGIDETLAHMRYKNVIENLETIKGLEGDWSDEQYDLLRKSAFATTSLKGISSEDAQQIVKDYASADGRLMELSQSQDELKVEAAATAAAIGISFEQAYDKIINREEQAKVSAVQTFRSMGDALSEFSEKAFNEEVTSDDILGLVETFPELLNETDVLGAAFSDLSLNGAVKDASTLQGILESISRLKLSELLQNEGIVDPKVISGLANTLDFSHYESSTLGDFIDNLQNNWGFTGLENIDLNSKIGKNIAGRLQYTIQMVGGITPENASVIQQVIQSTVAQATADGVSEGISQVQNLASSMSSLGDATSKILAGEFGIDDIASLEESFNELDMTGEELNSLYSSLSMDGFVKDAETANTVVNKLKLGKIEKFFKENETLSAEAQRAILNATRLSGIGQAEGYDAYTALQGKENVDTRKLKELYESGQYDVLVRLNLIPEFTNMDEFYSDVDSSLKAAEKDNLPQITTDLEVLTNLHTKNANITDFINQVTAGEATVDGLISLMQEIPEVALYSGESLANMISTADFDGTINTVEGLAKAMKDFTLENLYDQFKSIEDLQVAPQLKKALHDYIIDSTDLTGVTDRDIQDVLGERMPNKIINGIRRGKYSRQAVMNIALKGQIDSSDVEEKILAEQDRLNSKEISATITAQINFNSDVSSLNGLYEGLTTGQATSDDILNLMSSMQEFRDNVTEAGLAITDMDMDGFVDNAEKFQRVISATKMQKLVDFVKKDGVPKAQKMSSILNTSLKGITAADKMLNNSELLEFISGKNYSAEAVFKADMMIDSGLLSKDTDSMQAMLDSLDTDVRIRTKIDDFQQTMTGLESVNTAISEFNETGTVSTETMLALQQAGIDYNQVLFETESGFKVNTEAAGELSDSLANAGISMAEVSKKEYATQIQNNTKAMQKMVDEYNEANGTSLKLAEVLSDVGKYGGQFADVFALSNANAGLNTMITSLMSLQGQLRNSIDLFGKLQAAQSSANASDNYNTIKTAGEQAEKLWNQGWTGKDDFVSFAQLIAPNGTEEDDAIANFEQNYQKVKKYLTEDASGLYTFLDDTQAKGFYRETDQGMQLIIDDLDDFADQMGISTSMAEQMLFALSDIGMKVDFSSITDKFRDSIDEIDETSATAGQQIQNAVDEMQYLAASGADPRSAMEPLIESINEFHNLHPEQDIQPWIDSLTQLGLLNGFTLSVNEDGSLTYVTSELEQACSLIQQIRGSDPSTVEVGVEVSDEQKVMLHKLFSTEEGRQELIKVGFEINENTKFSDLVAQLTDPNHEFTIPIKLEVENNPLSDDSTKDTETWQHEMRKGLANLTPEETVSETPTIETQFKLKGMDQANQQLDDFTSEAQKPLQKQITYKITEESSSSSAPSKPEADTGVQGERGFKNTSTTVGADTGQIDDAKKKIDELDKVKVRDKNFRVNAINLTAVMNNLTTVQNTQLEDKSFHVLAPGLPTVLSQISSTVSKLNELHDKTINIKINRTGSTGGGDGSGVLGTAHSSGTAKYIKPAHMSATAYAGGRDFTVGRNETALVNELGVESRVHDGKWELLPGGPHFQKLDKDDIIFNAKQTKDLIESGRTARRGKIVGAFSKGTASGINAYDIGKRNAEGVDYVATASDKRMNRPNSSTSDNTQAQQANTDATEQNTSAKNENTKKEEKEGQVFDWVASRLSYLADQTSKFADSITDFISYSDKMVNLIGDIDANGNIVTNKEDSVGRVRKGQLQSLLEEIAGNRAGAARYQQEANAVKAPYSNPKKASEKEANAKFESTKKMIDAGYKIDIETIKDEKLASAISSYQSYADSARQAANNVDDLNRSLVELYATWAKSPAEEAEKQIERLRKDIEGLERAEARLDAISKGGSTQMQLDRILGNDTSGNYTLLGANGTASTSAGFAAVRAENARKTASKQAELNERKQATQRARQNLADFQKYSAKQAEDKTEIAEKYITSSEVSSLTKKDIKDAGKKISDKYKLTGKIKKKLESGQNVSDKDIKKSKKKVSKKAKKAIQDQNDLVQQYQDENPSIDSKTTSKLDKAVKLTSKQKEALKKGEKLELTKAQKKKLKKNKKLKNAVDNYNTKVANKPSTTNLKVNPASVVGTTSDQDTQDTNAQGLQTFVDELNSAETDEITAAAELAAQKVQEIKDNFDYLNEAYETQIAYQSDLNKLNERFITNAETFGNTVTSQDRDFQIQNVRQNLDAAQKEAKDLEAQLISAVNNGDIVEGSQEWVDMQTKIIKAKQAVNDYSVQIKQIELKKLEDIEQHYERQAAWLESIIKLNEKAISEAETFGNSITSSMRDQQKENLTLRRNQEAAKADRLQKQLDQDVANGVIQEGSGEWMKIMKQINDARASVNDLDIQIKQVELKKFDDIEHHYAKQLEYLKAIHAQMEQGITDAQTFGNSITAHDRDVQKSNLALEQSRKQQDVNDLKNQLDASVANGTIQVGSLQWMNLKKQIFDAEAEVHNYAVQIKKIELKKLEDIEHHYETQIEYLKKLRKYQEQNISDAEKYGDQVTARDRDNQIKNVQRERQKKQTEADSLEKQLAESVANETIEEGSLEWLKAREKILEARDAVHEYDLEMKDLEIKKIEDITNHYGKIVSFLQSIVDLNNVWNDRDEIVGNYRELSYYTQNIASSQAIANKKMKQAEAAQLQFNELVQKGVYVEGTDSYLAKQAEMNALWKEAYDAENAVAKLEAERIQFEIDNFNRVLDKQVQFIDNLNTMAGLINDAAKWDYDTGNLTEQGQLTMVVDKQSYENAIADIQAISKEKDRLLQELQTNANYGQQAFDEDIKELTDRQMQSLQNAKSALESFTQTVVTTAQKQLEALNKVIDKRKEALSKEQE